MKLDDQDRAALLRIARRTIESFLGDGTRPVFEDVGPRLLEPGGAFVTLHAEGQLRGCIGTFEVTHPLAETVSRMAVAAATSDPRFPPVRPEELQEITIEISVLSPRRRILDPGEVQVGVHGLHVQRGTRRGVLLPQVPVEAGWDRETFLDHTCRKAGLPPEAWRDPSTLIEVFTAEVFGEHPPR